MREFNGIIINFDGMVINGAFSVNGMIHFILCFAGLITHTTRFMIHFILRFTIQIARNID